MTQDVVAPVCESMDRPLSAKGRVTLTRWLIVVIGLYVLYWGLVYQGEDDIWDYMAVTGAIYSTGAFSLLLCGLYWRRASSRAAFLSLLAGGTALLGLSPVQEMLGLDLPSARVGLVSVGVAVAVMVVGSLLLPDTDRPMGKQADAKGEM